MVPPELLTDRELATVFWLSLLGLAVIALGTRNAEVRASLGHLLTLRFPPELPLLVALFAGWVALAVGLASLLGFWNADLTTDTLLWFLVPGLGLFVSLGEVGQERFLRRRLWRTIGLSAFVAFYLNILAFHIAIEIAIQPLATVLVAAAALSRAPLHKRLAERMLRVLGVALLVATTLNIAANAASLDLWQVSLTWLLPVWLTIAALPFVYLLGIYDHYRVLFALADLDAADWRARLQARAAMLTSLRGDAGELVAARRSLYTIRQVAIASDFASARAALERNQADRRAQLEAERRKAADLVRLAGTRGTDEEARQLDRREFEETTRALSALATRQMSWYQNRGKCYRREVLELMAHHHALKGLPAEHGARCT